MNGQSAIDIRVVECIYSHLALWIFLIERGTLVPQRILQDFLDSLLETPSVECRTPHEIMQRAPA
jgi:hypothetical protein